MTIDNLKDYNQEIKIEENIPELPKSLSIEERFKFAYEFIQKKFEIKKHSLKPCMASLLVYGVKDRWKSLLYPLVFEVLRVVEFDKDRALEILELYYKNSEKKQGRDLNRIKRQVDYTLRKREKIKISCDYLMNRVDCVNKETCYKIRGFKKRCGMKKEEVNEYVRAQISAYLLRLIESGIDKKLSPEAYKIYTYLVELKFLRGVEWVFVSYRDLSKIIGKKSHKIRLYLNELKDNFLIVYDVGKPSFKEKKAYEIRILNLFKDPINRIDEILS